MTERRARRPVDDQPRRGRRHTGGSFRSLMAAFGALVAATLVLIGNVHAEKQEHLIVVVDGSGSMWGALEGTQKGKLGFARDAFTEAVQRIQPQAALGLITFGARSGASCQAAEALVAPSHANIAAVSEALAKFNPQGRGPIVLGLEWARDQVVKAPPGSAILLVHDGDDNCGGDMCQFAKSFAQSVPGVKINAISLGLKAEDRAGAACLTKTTGGRWFEAETADDAAAGFEAVLASFARSRRRPDETAQPAPGAAATQLAAQPPGPGDGNIAAWAVQPTRPANAAVLKLDAVLKATGARIPSGVKWRIKAAGESGDDAFNRSFDRNAVSVNLAPGRYNVTLETKLVQENRSVVVRSGQTQNVAFALDGGFLDIKTIGSSALQEGPAPVATLEALAAKVDERAVVWSGGLGQESGFLVAPGRYRVTLGDGLGQAVQTLEIKNGEVRALALQAGQARLAVHVRGLDEKQMAAAVVEVAADDPTAAGGRRPVARSAANDARFHLAPGTYHVTLSVFGDTTTDIVVVPGGETVKQEIGIVQMGLNVSARLGPNAEPVGGDVRYRLWRAGQLNTPLRVSREAAPTFYLVPGKYRIESRLGQQNAVIVREFEIGRQHYGKLALTHDAGRVSFKRGDGGKIVDNNAFWALIDQNQRLIWRTIAASPEMTLKAGLYTVRVASEQRTYFAKFAVVAGHDQTVTLSEE